MFGTLYAQEPQHQDDTISETEAMAEMQTFEDMAVSFGQNTKAWSEEDEEEE